MQKAKCKMQDEPQGSGPAILHFAFSIFTSPSPTGYWLLATLFLPFASCLLIFDFSVALAAPFVYVTNEKSDDVTVIDAATDRVVTTVKVGQRPRGIVVSPDNKRVYVSNGNSNDVSVI